MVVMMVAVGGVGFYVATFVVAVVCGSFQLQGGMGDSVLVELFTDQVLNGVGICICYDVEGGAVVVAVQAPNVEVVDLQDTLNVGQVFLDLLRVYVMGRFLQEDMDDFLEMTGGMEEDEQGHGNGQDGVNKGEVRELHDQGSYQDYEPAQDILQHMEVYRLLIQGVASTGEEGGTKVDSYTDDSKEDHAIVVDLRRVQDPEDGIVHDHEGACQEDQGCNGSPQNGVSSVAVGIGLIRVFFAFPFQEIG